ncbi:MAG: DUF4388 domain-containing protein [Vicinamibacteria bacterium]
MKLAKTGKIARPNTGSTLRPDFSGQIEVFSLFEVFEMLNAGRKSGVLKIITTLGEGKCVLNRGTLISASIFRLSDGEAVIEMLSNRTGFFAFTAAPPTEAKAGLELTSLLMETVRLEDEFERNSAHYPEEGTRLGLSARGIRVVTDDLSCGAPQVLEVIANKPRITTPQLMAAIPLASLKIRLAVAWLSSSGILGEYHTQAMFLQGILDTWHQKLLFLGGGGSRILFAASAEDGPQEIFDMISAIAVATKAPMPELTLPHDGPGVVRLRPPTGGLISITILPIHKRHRSTFQSLAASAQLVAMGGSARSDEGAAWLGLIPETTGLVSWEESQEGPHSLRDALRDYADSRI